MSIRCFLSGAGRQEDVPSELLQNEIVWQFNYDLILTRCKLYDTILTRCQNKGKEAKSMPRGSPERIKKRKSEILDACERIYREQGFYGVNIKEISTETSFTRPAIYNYFETKEEILLGLLAREYERWCNELEGMIPLGEKVSRAQLAEQIAHTLEKKETLLRILNMNLFEIEQNSRVERLAEFKKLYSRSVTALAQLLNAFKPDIPDKECEAFCESFLAFLFGVYPFAFHTEKQKEAMNLAGVRFREPTIYQMVYQCLLRLIPDKIEHKNSSDDESIFQD